MADRIVVEFDGDAKGLIVTVNGATKSIGDFDKKTQTTLNNLEKNLQGVGGAATKSGAQIKASNTNYLNFGRVIQDLPFGLIGIQNNLTQLIPSIGLLGLGFSIVISALTFLQTGTDNWTRGLKNNGDAIGRNLDLTRQFNTELAKGNASAMTEISLLNSYLTVAKDETVSRNGRLQAIKAINDIMPDYLGDIKLDGINSDETAKKIDKYTKSVFLNAKVKAASSLIEKEYTKQFEAQAKSVEDNATGLQKTGAVIGSAIVGIGEEFKQLNQLNPFAVLNIGATGAAKAVETYNSSVTRLGKNELEKTINGSNIAINAFNKILNESNKELAELGLLFADDKTGNAGKKLKTVAEILKELNTELKINAGQLDKSPFDKAVLDLNSFQKALDDLTKNGLEKQGTAVDDLKKRYDNLFNTLFDPNKARPTLGKVNPLISATDNVVDGVVIKDVTLDHKAEIKNIPVGGLAFKKVDTSEFDKAVSASLKNSATSIISTLSTIGEQGSSIFANLGNTLVHTFDDIFSNQLSNAFEELATTGQTSIKGLEFALAALAGSIISGLGTPGKKGNVGLKTVGGAVSGAATGALAGSVVPGIGTAIGAVVGGILGGISGLLNGSKQQRQAEMQAKELAESEKQTKLLEQANALAYTSSIIGRMTNQGTVTGFEINEFGNLVAKIQGKDLLIMLDKAEKAKRRGV